MSPFSSLLLLLAGMSPAALLAQADAPDRPAPASAGTEAPKPARPADERVVTTADGKPLPPELMEKVLKLLESDPDVQALSVLPDGSLVKREADNAEIRVTSKRPRGRPLGDPEPIRTYSPIDIRAYGASTVGELIGALGDQAVSHRGAGERQPIVLLNGRRISSFEEIALYPPEAIERAEVFTEDLALRYGYPANQKVVNLVTFKYFAQQSGQAGLLRATEGGGGQDSLNLQMLRIVDETRYNAHLGLRRSDRILESQRDIDQPAGEEDQAPYRSLQPKALGLAASGAVSGLVSDKIVYTLRASGSLDRSDALLGIAADRPLRQRLDGHAITIGEVLNGQIGKWQWSSTASYGATSSTSTVRQDGGAAPASISRARLGDLAADLSMTGGLFSLPAGSALATLRAAYDGQDIHTTQPAGSGLPPLALSRDSVGAFANLSVPISDRGKKGALGNLSLGGFARAQHVSDRGEVLGFGGTVYWSPVEALRLFVSAGRETRAPALSQIGAPIVALPNVRVYDLSRGETVGVVQRSGGNPELRDQTAQSLDVSLVVKPIRAENLLISFDYGSARTRDAISALSTLDPAVMAFFNDRFTRDPAGRLTSIDVRPVNVRQVSETKLATSLNWTRSLAGSTAASNLIFAPASNGGPPPPGVLPPNSRIIDAPPGAPLPPEIENALSRIYVSLSHVWRFRDRARLGAGGPVLDLLDGFALDGLQTVSRHEVFFSGGVFRRGIGLRATLDWRSGNRLPAGGSPLSADGLRFSYRPTLGFHVSVNPQDRIVGHIPGWIRGMQVILNIANALDSRPAVRDRLGRTPLRFQSAYLDPVGRSIELSVRKIF